jgi:hypothetical protein
LQSKLALRLAKGKRSKVQSPKSDVFKSAPRGVLGGKGQNMEKIENVKNEQ